jgi:hypothetical protein
MRILALIILLTTLAMGGASRADDLKTGRMLDGRVEILLPTGFEPMPQNLREIKYPSKNRPQDIYANDAGNVNIASSRLPFPEGGSLDTLIPVFANAMDRMRHITSWEFKGKRSINGRDFGVLAFVAQAIDKDIYVYTYFTRVGDELFMLTANSTVEQLPDWKDKLMASIDSTKIKE